MERPNTCIICTESLDDLDMPLKECGHWIHPACVKKHFKPECPICRTPLNIKVTGTKPETYIPDRSPDSIFGMVHFFLISNNSDNSEDSEDGGYLYPEEHPDFDEENPHGDNWNYGDY